MNPLVSIITPATHDRKPMIDRLQVMLSAQDYPSIEWLIDYGAGTIGSKRNALCERAKGEIILHADSDDLYGPKWITNAVASLTDSNASVTGLANAWFYDTGGKLYEYNYTGGQPFVCGATMCYWRKTWEGNRFRNISIGEDRIFCTNAGRVKYMDYKEGFAAIIHGANTCSHVAIVMRVKEMAPSKEKVPLIERYYPSTPARQVAP